MDKWGFALRLIGIGWYVAFSILLGALGGVWLDRIWGTTPILALIGIVLGTIVAFYGLYRMLLPIIEDRPRGPKERS